MAHNTPAALQEFLDSLSQVPGSLIYRDRYQWNAIPPGEPGQILAWQPETGLGWVDPPEPTPPDIPDLPLIARTLEPATGPDAGGTLVTITVENLEPDEPVTVIFEETESPSAAITGPDTIEATSPPGTGVADIVVSQGFRAAALGNAFEFLSPEPSASHDWTSPGLKFWNPNRHGFRFTVGPSDITVTELQVNHAQAGRLEHVKLHRWSDGALLADAVITSQVDTWVGEAVTPITLQAGEDYVISTMLEVYGNRRNHYTGSDIAFASGFTVVEHLEQFTYDMPTTTTSRPYAAARFLFTP